MQPQLSNRACPTANQLAIVYTAIESLRLDPANPRLHSRKQVRQIARSIDTFGFNVPVLIDSDRKVIAGHGRVLACRELGWKEIPAVRLDHLTDAQARAFMIADNRLTENSTWDSRLLGEQLKALSDLDLDFGLDITGFEVSEIDLIIEEASASVPSDPADEVLPSHNGPPVCRPGDLWLLGRHRILCGSALDEPSYGKLLEHDRASIVFTDPPYNVPIDGHVCARCGPPSRVRHGRG
jgi:hypothetical protein